MYIHAGITIGHFLFFNALRHTIVLYFNGFNCLFCLNIYFSNKQTSTNIFYYKRTIKGHNIKSLKNCIERIIASSNCIYQEPKQKNLNAKIITFLKLNSTTAIYIECLVQRISR